MQTYTIPQGTKELTIETYNDKIVIEFVPEKTFKPKDGDIIADSWPTVAIFNSTSDTGGAMYHAAILKGDLSITEQPCVGIGYTNKFRPATPSEAQLLFDKLAEAGYRWNAEEKKVEKVRWRASNGEKYWTFDLSEVDDAVFEDKDSRTLTDDIRYDNYTYFRTRTQAEAAFEAVKNLLLNTEF